MEWIEYNENDKNIYAEYSEVTETFLDCSSGAERVFHSSIEIQLMDSCTIRFENEFDFSGAEPVLKSSLTIEQL